MGERRWVRTKGGLRVHDPSCSSLGRTKHAWTWDWALGMSREQIEQGLTEAGVAGVTFCRLCVPQPPPPGSDGTPGGHA